MNGGLWALLPGRPGALKGVGGSACLTSGITLWAQPGQLSRRRVPLMLFAPGRISTRAKAAPVSLWLSAPALPRQLSLLCLLRFRRCYQANAPLFLPSSKLCRSPFIPGLIPLMSVQVQKAPAPFCPFDLGNSDEPDAAAPRRTTPLNTLGSASCRLLY